MCLLLPSLNIFNGFCNLLNLLIQSFYTMLHLFDGFGIMMFFEIFIIWYLDSCWLILIDFKHLIGNLILFSFTGTESLEPRVKPTVGNVIIGLITLFLSLILFFSNFYESSFCCKVPRRKYVLLVIWMIFFVS